ncbi:hypothetical protein F4775DRAFT_91261 [Biscogniauxia sp. FL1348]|nr:hypothetical protein F4775DRAFT_91261 [Biscogniauxia sp. FL1348]
MRIQTFFATLLAASVSTALETNTFRLAVGAMKNDLTPSINRAYVGFQTTGDCQAELVAERGAGTLFYQSKGKVLAVDSNGLSSAGIVVTPGGSATVPSNRLVGLQCDNGTSGVQIRQTPSAVTFELDFEGGVWMACPATDGTDRIGIIYRKSSQRSLEGCAEVKLFSSCEDGSPEGSESVGCNKL